MTIRIGVGRPTSAVLAALLILASAGAIRGQSEGVETNRKELDRLKSEIETNRRRIEDLRKREQEAAELRAGLETDRRLTRRYLDQLGEQERALRGDHARRQSELLEMESRAAETADRLRERLRSYHRFRFVSGEAMLFSSESFSQLFARGQFLKELIRRDQLDLVALAQDREAIAEASAELERRRSELDRVFEEKRAEEKRLEARGESVDRALAEIRDERSEHERRLRQLEASQAQIRKMLEQLERDRRRGEPLAFGEDLASRRGRLLWPVEGEVLAEFGLEVHPRYRTQVPNNGIVIRAPEGAPIAACAPGEVVYVGWYDGYGRTVILTHGNGFYTIYAHASRILVAQGDRVEAGQKVAEVGDTDSFRGSCLHFEIRRESEALDPREWLRR